LEGNFIMPTMTNVTTAELAYYKTDMQQVSPLTDEEQQRLIACVAAAHAGHLPMRYATAAKQRLIEGNLYLAGGIALKRCPYNTLAPDLVQEASLALIKAVNHYDYTTRQKSFTGYLIVYIRESVRAAIGHDTPIYVDHHAFTRARARQDGTLKELYTLARPLSLDTEDDDERSLLEQLEDPSMHLSDPVDQEQQEQQHPQVEALLAKLPIREQAVVRMSYGLLEEDGRVYSQAAIARTLHLGHATVASLKKNALARLAALAHGTAEITDHPSEEPTTCTERLAHAYAQLQAEGVSISVSVLARRAATHWKTANKFLQERHQIIKQPPIHERLEIAYAQLRGQEALQQPMTATQFARLAGVHRQTACRFLAQQQGTQRAGEHQQEKMLAPTSATQEREVVYASV
jgi:RNA polymerase sigma factor (sigma-70 family)